MLFPSIAQWTKKPRRKETVPDIKGVASITWRDHTGTGKDQRHAYSAVQNQCVLSGARKDGDRYMGTREPLIRLGMKQGRSCQGCCKVICCPVQTQNMLSSEELEDSHLPKAPRLQKPGRGLANEKARVKFLGAHFANPRKILPCGTNSPTGPWGVSGEPKPFSSGWTCPVKEIVESPLPRKCHVFIWAV